MLGEDYDGRHNVHHEKPHLLQSLAAGLTAGGLPVPVSGWEGCLAVSPTDIGWYVPLYRVTNIGGLGWNRTSVG